MGSYFDLRCNLYGKGWVTSPLLDVGALQRRRSQEKLITVTLPDGSKKEYEKGVTLEHIAADIGPRLLKDAIAGKVDGKMVDLNSRIESDSEVEILTFSDDEGKQVYWHSTSHIMAQAVVQLFPEAKVTIGPPIEDGFYYDFDVPEPFTPQDLEKIEDRMGQILVEDYPFQRQVLTRDEAIKTFKEMGEAYKVEILDGIDDGEVITAYRQGSFFDLCRGPHVPSTGAVKAFKLLRSSGAYWRGDERNKMLQRIYGISFPKRAGLDEHIEGLEEAKRRDHRVLGRELDLFSINQSVGPGLILWHPKGGRIRTAIEDFWRKAHYDGGYELVYSPHIGKGDLWETSGHLDFFKENMYSSMDIEGQEYYLKPMNCPFHIQIYRSHLRSYRDLPFRWAELGTVYRYERSGTLYGLSRVRGFTQDDAHIFCRPDQVEDEILGVIDFTLDVLGSFGFKDKDIQMYLSTKPEKAVGSDEDWERATEALRRAIDKKGLSYQVDEGGGSFYGPKIDLYIRDSIGHSWQCTTIQFDFNMPERFDMTFVGEDGKDKRPYMVHRTLLGSMERFFGALIEHYAGAFPLWLAPVQALVLPITDDHMDYAQRVADELKKEGIRAEVEKESGKLGNKIRKAEVQKIPYMAVVGAKEIEKETVSLRSHGRGDLGALSLEDLKRKMLEEIEVKGQF